MSMEERGRFLLCSRTGALGSDDEPRTCPVHGEGASCMRVFIPAPQLTDPRELGGSVAGPGGPMDEGAFIIDSRRAILMDSLEVVKVDDSSGMDALAMLAGGRINRSEDTARVMFLGDLDMLAAFITEAHGLAERMGRQDELHGLCRARWERMPHPEG